MSGMPPGITWDVASAERTGRGWTARTYTDDKGTNIGMTRFRPTEMVNAGTGEELIVRLTDMMPGARVERRTSHSGVTSHLARSDRRIDMGPVLASVGLHVTNTNSMAQYLLQSFVTNTTTVASTPTHRDANNAVLIQLRGSKEVLIHPPTQSLPGCPADIFASATLTDSRWLDVDPFKLSRAYSSEWVKVVMVPGDVVVVPKLWWHAVRSTPGSVAISVPVRLDEIDERTRGRRTCRRDTQPAPARRDAGPPASNEEPPNSRRADYSLGADGPVAHFYALTDTQLATACRMPYERIEGRVVTWNTNVGLATSAENAAAELGVSAQHTRDLTAWMASFQLRPTLEGAVLAAHADEPDEQMSLGSRQATLRARDEEDDDQLRYSPADSYNEAGDLRVYTQPLRSGWRTKSWPGFTPRYAIHEAVDARVASCMDLDLDGTSYETHAAFVTYQHDDGTCNVRLADDLLTVISRVHVQLSRDLAEADTRDRLLEYQRDMHNVEVLYTERGARVQRRGNHRMYGKRYSMDVTGDGASARELKRKCDHHQDEHERLCHDDGTYMTEEEQVAKVMELSELDGGPLQEAASPLALTSDLALQPAIDASSLPAVMPHSTPVNATENPRAPEAEHDDTPDVVVVPAPPKPPIQLIDISDERSDELDGGKSDCDGNVGNLNGQPDGNATLETRRRTPAPPRPTPHSSLLQRLRDNVDHPVRRPLNANLMVAHELYVRRPTLRHDSGTGTAAASMHGPERRPTAAQQRAQWGHIEVPLSLRDWHTEANQQYAAEMANKRRRTDGGSYRGGGHGTAPPYLRTERTAEPRRGRPARAPAAAPAEAPRATQFMIVNCSETAGELCSTRGCYRPRRHYRIDRDQFTSEPVCCPSCTAPTVGLTPVVEHVHSDACNYREADRRRQRSITLTARVPRHPTSVNRMSDESTGGSARGPWRNRHLTETEQSITSSFPEVKGDGAMHMEDAEIDDAFKLTVRPFNLDDIERLRVEPTMLEALNDFIFYTVHRVVSGNDALYDDPTTETVLDVARNFEMLRVALAIQEGTGGLNLLERYGYQGPWPGHEPGMNVTDPVLALMEADIPPGPDIVEDTCAHLYVGRVVFPTTDAQAHAAGITIETAGNLSSYLLITAEEFMAAADAALVHPSLTTAAKKRRAIQQLHDVIAVQEGTLHFTALTSYAYRGADGAHHHWFVLDDHEDDRHLSATEQGTTAAFPEVTGDGAASESLSGAVDEPVRFVCERQELECVRAGVTIEGAEALHHFVGESLLCATHAQNEYHRRPSGATATAMEEARSMVSDGINVLSGTIPPATLLQYTRDDNGIYGSATGSERAFTREMLNLPPLGTAEESTAPTIATPEFLAQQTARRQAEAAENPTRIADANDDTARTYPGDVVDTLVTAQQARSIGIAPPTAAKLSAFLQWVLDRREAAETRRANEPNDAHGPELRDFNVLTVTALDVAKGRMPLWALRRYTNPQSGTTEQLFTEEEVERAQPHFRSTEPGYLFRLPSQTQPPDLSNLDATFTEQQARLLGITMETAAKLSAYISDVDERQATATDDDKTVGSDTAEALRLSLRRREAVVKVACGQRPLETLASLRYSEGRGPRIFTNAEIETARAESIIRHPVTPLTSHATTMPCSKSTEADGGAGGAGSTDVWVANHETGQTDTTRNASHVSRHATSVARMNDGAAGGSARSHNDD